jgi:hypothetical protein
MQAGFIADAVSGGAQVAPTWVEGPVEIDWKKSAKVKGRQKGPVRTYRCRSCGLLESYVTELDS